MGSYKAVWPRGGLVHRAWRTSCQDETHGNCLLTEARCLPFFEVLLWSAPPVGRGGVFTLLAHPTNKMCVFLAGAGLFAQRHTLEGLSTSSGSLHVKRSRTQTFLRNIIFFSPPPLPCFHINNCKRLGRNSTFLKDFHISKFLLPCDWTMLMRTLDSPVGFWLWPVQPYERYPVYNSRVFPLYCSAGGSPHGFSFVSIVLGSPSFLSRQREGISDGFSDPEQHNLCLPRVQLAALFLYWNYVTLHF